MKFTIKKELLLDSLIKVSKALSTKNLIPVLGGIKFELKRKKLTLTASDNESGIDANGPLIYRNVISTGSRTDQITNTNYW